MPTLSKIILKKGRDIPLKAGHPWVFSNAVEGVEGKVGAGDLVEVYGFFGEALGIGTCNPQNSIQVRMLTHNIHETIDDEWMSEKLIALDEDKKGFLPEKTTAYRVAHADADFLPGLILDRYGDHFVFQIHTAGMEKLRDCVISAIQKAFQPKVIVERSDVEARTLEGLKKLPPHIHVGKLKEAIKFTESGIPFWADFVNGQKTGFFLDQREARRRVGELAKGRSVLNLFSYTGAFSVYAALGGATSVTSVDVSKSALETAKKNFELSKLDPKAKKYQFVEADVLDFLETYNQKYDLIICDPPAFGKSLSQVERALQAYTDLNERCFVALNPQGILVSSSCSGRVSAEDFRYVLKIASGRARQDAKIIDFLAQPYDHTQKLAFPEGAYLKTFVVGL